MLILRRHSLWTAPKMYIFYDSFAFFIPGSQNFYRNTYKSNNNLCQNKAKSIILKCHLTTKPILWWKAPQYIMVWINRKVNQHRHLTLKYIGNQKFKNSNTLFVDLIACLIWGLGTLAILHTHGDRRGLVVKVS